MPVLFYFFTDGNSMANRQVKEKIVGMNKLMPVNG